MELEWFVCLFSSTNCFQWYLRIGCGECVICNRFADRWQTLWWSWMLRSMRCICCATAGFWAPKTLNCSRYLNVTRDENINIFRMVDGAVSELWVCTASRVFFGMKRFRRIRNWQWVYERYLWLTTDYDEYEYAMQCIYQISDHPNVRVLWLWAIEVVFVCPRYDIRHPSDAHHNDQFQANPTQCRSVVEK